MKRAESSPADRAGLSGDEATATTPRSAGHRRQAVSDCVDHKFVPVTDGPRPNLQGWTYEGIVNIEGVAHWHYTRPC